MKKNTIISLLVLGMMVFPTIFVQAETSVEADASVRMNNRVDAESNVSAMSRSDKDEKSMDDDKMQREDMMRLDTQVLIKNRMMRLDAMKDIRTRVESDLKTRRAEIIAKIMAEKSERKVKLEADAQVRVKNLLDNMFNMLSRHLDRLSTVDEKINAKIDDLENKGADVSTVVKLHATAYTALTKARVDVEATQTLAVEQTATETSRETMRALVKTAEESIRVAGRAYKDMIPELVKLEASVRADVDTDEDDN